MKLKPWKLFTVTTYEKPNYLIIAKTQDLNGPSYHSIFRSEQVDKMIALRKQEQ